MIQRKDRNFIKKMIREELVEQMNKSSFKTKYKPNESTEDNNTPSNGGL